MSDDSVTGLRNRMASLTVENIGLRTMLEAVQHEHDRLTAENSQLRGDRERLIIAGERALHGIKSISDLMDDHLTLGAGKFAIRPNMVLRTVRDDLRAALAGSAPTGTPTGTDND